MRTKVSNTGFHHCMYCNKAISSGDVVLMFDSGHSYVMPDMILHYIAVHYYLPPVKFIDDVMNSTITVNINVKERIGYLDGNYCKAPVPDSFFMKLWELMQNAPRRQTRGIAWLVGRVDE